MSGKGQPAVVYPEDCQEVNTSLSKDDLIKRLAKIAKNLQECEQEDESNAKYANLAVYLTSEAFLEHNSADVRLLIACCVVDLLRIFAPDPPFPSHETQKDVLLFLATQLRGLTKIESPSYKRYFYVLESLALVKSYSICLDLEECQTVMATLFKVLFEVVSENHTTKVLSYSLDIMAGLIRETDFVSQQVLDTILENIVGANKMISEPARRLAQELIVKVKEALEPSIQSFLNGVLIIGKTESELSDHVLELIYELQTTAPTTLVTVLPQLEFRLKSDDQKERQSVTKLLGQMYLDHGSKLIESNEQLWLSFLGRMRDIDLAIRLDCVTFALQVLQKYSASLPALTQRLMDSSHDLDESVRVEVVMGIVKAAKLNIALVNDQLLSGLKDRSLDKKFKVRQEAITGLGSIYKRYVSNSSGATPPPTTDVDLSWIPDRVLHGYFQPNHGDKITVERSLLTHLVPYHLTTTQRMRALLHLYVSIDENSIKSLHEIFKSQSQLKTLTREVISLDLSQEGAEKTLNVKAYQIAKMLPDSVKGAEGVKLLSTKVQSDTRLSMHLSALLADDCPCSKAEDHVKNVLSRLGNPGSSNTVYSVVKVLLERASSLLLDQAAVPPLLALCGECHEGTTTLIDRLPPDARKHTPERVLNLLTALSTCFPHAFWSEDTFPHMLSFLNSTDESVAGTALQLLLNTAKAKTLPADFVKSLLPRLVSLCESGTAKQGKYAVTCLGKFLQKEDLEEILDPLFDHCETCLHPDNESLETALVVIGMIALLAPGLTYKRDMKGVMKKIQKQILLQDRIPHIRTIEVWMPEERLSLLSASKRVAMKAVVRWLHGLLDLHASTKDTEEARLIMEQASKFAQNAFALLQVPLKRKGDFTGGGHTMKAEMAQIRLAAGLCILKTVNRPTYSSILSHEQFQSLALLVNDTCINVRTQFTQKLHRHLILQKIPLQYMSIFTFVANDPSKQRRVQVKNFMVMNIQRRRDYLRTHSVTSGPNLFSVLPDYVIPYTVHLLAHDPDLKGHTDVESLKNLKECLWFMLEPLMKDNSSFYALHRKIFDLIKCTKDAQNPDDEPANHKMYAICDLGVGLLMTRASFGASRTESGNPMLPSRCFVMPEENEPPNTKTYLPQDLLFAPTMVMKSRMHPKTVISKTKGKDSGGAGGVVLTEMDAESSEGNKDKATNKSGGDNSGEGGPEDEEWSPGSKENSDIAPAASGGSGDRLTRGDNQRSAALPSAKDEKAVPLKKRKRGVEARTEEPVASSAPSSPPTVYSVPVSETETTEGSSEVSSQPTTRKRGKVAAAAAAQPGASRSSTRAKKTGTEKEPAAAQQSKGRTRKAGR